MMLINYLNNNMNGGRFDPIYVLCPDLTAFEQFDFLISISIPAEIRGQCLMFVP